MYVGAAGLTPMSPTIEVVPVVEIPVFANMVKLPAVPRFTAGCAAYKSHAITRKNMMYTETFTNVFFSFIFSLPFAYCKFFTEID